MKFPDTIAIQKLAIEMHRVAVKLTEIEEWITEKKGYPELYFQGLEDLEQDIQDIRTNYDAIVMNKYEIERKEQ